MDEGTEDRGVQQDAQPVDKTTAILASRGADYGDFTYHANITQHLKDILRNIEGWNRLSANQKEALDMIMHKVGRILNGNPDLEDSWADIAGYARLAADRVRK